VRKFQNLLHRIGKKGGIHALNRGSCRCTRTAIYHGTECVNIDTFRCYISVLFS